MNITATWRPLHRVAILNVPRTVRFQLESQEVEIPFYLELTEGKNSDQHVSIIKAAAV